VSHLQIGRMFLKDTNIRTLLEKWPHVLCSIKDRVGKVMLMVYAHVLCSIKDQVGKVTLFIYGPHFGEKKIKSLSENPLPN